MSSIIQMSLSIPTPTRTNLSSLRVLTDQTQTHFLLKFPNLSITHNRKPKNNTIIRMGGGPRTYPGGVSKWQWKRMRSKKSKQLLKARLTRERQIYEMRKRAELREAVLELERPWEVVERAPALFSVKADEQLKVLADRFQKPGGFDFWSENDGPELFKSCSGGVDDENGIPTATARFFPKGVVHSIKPYERLRSGDDDDNEDSWKDSSVKRSNGSRRTRRDDNRRGTGESNNEGEDGFGTVRSWGNLDSSEEFSSLGSISKSSNGSRRTRRNDNRRGRGESNSEGEDGFGTVRSWGNLDSSDEFKEFSSLGPVSKSSNGFRRTRRNDNGRGRGELDSGRENGGGNLMLRKGNEDGKRSYAKRFAFLGGNGESGEDNEGFGSVEGRQSSRDFNGGRGGKGSYRGNSRRNGSEERGEYMEGFSSAEGRGNSRDFNGGRGGRGSYRGNSRRNGSEERREGMEGFRNDEGRHNSREFNGERGGRGSFSGSSRRNGSGGNLGSRNSDRLNSGNERRNEIPFRGRGGGSNGIDRQYNARKGSSRPPRTGEVYEMSLKGDGTYEI